MNALAAGLSGFKLKKTKGVEELENEKRAQALEERKVPDSFIIPEWLNSGSGWPGEPQVCVSSYAPSVRACVCVPNRS